MRNNLIFAILTLISGQGICQGDSTKKVIEYGLSFNNIYRNEFNYSPQLTVSYGGFLAKVGPLYGKNEMTWGYTSELEKKKINGGVLTFQINPNKKGKLFDFFFVTNISIVHFKKDKYLTTPVYGHYEDTELLLFEPTFGYGFKIKFLKHFYITNDIAFGFSFQKVKYADESTAKKNGSTGSLLVGVGYYFKLKNKGIK